MIIVGKLWINIKLIFVLTDPTKSTTFRNINFFSLTIIKKRTKYYIFNISANFLVRNIKFNVHISITIHIMIKILSFVFWKLDTFSGQTHTNRSYSHQWRQQSAIPLSCRLFHDTRVAEFSGVEVSQRHTWSECCWKQMVPNGLWWHNRCNMSSDFSLGCDHRCSHNVSILTCVCTTRPSRTWSTGVGVFHRPLLKAATHHRYTVPNMCSNSSVCPSSFPQAYNVTQFKCPNCNNRCKMLGTIYRRMTFGTFMTDCMKEYTAALPPEGATLCIYVTVWVPLTVTCVSFGLNFIIYSLIWPISFHFIGPCDGASGMVGRHPCYSRTYMGLHRISSLDPTLCWTRVEDIYLNKTRIIHALLTYNCELTIISLQYKYYVHFI